MHFSEALTLLVAFAMLGVVNAAPQRNGNNGQNQNGNQNADNNAGNNNNGNTGNNAGNAAGSGTALDAANVQDASASDGNPDQAAGQSASLTDDANFINFCSGKDITNGLQNTGGSCNGIVMGDIPSQGNMISSIIVNPAPGDNLDAETTFQIQVQVANLVAGTFTNPANTYYAAPQQLQGGKVVGHTHVTVQDLGNSLTPNNPPDASKFAFFLGINDEGNGNGLLSATVNGGLPAGNYRVCTMTSASNHQPVLMPVAQRGAQDDCTKFTVGGNAGGNNNNQAAGNNQNAGNQNAGNQNAGNQNTGNQAAGNQDTGNQAAGNQNTGNQNTGNQNTGSQNTGNQNTGGQATGNQNTGNQATGDQATGNQNTGNQDNGNQATGNQNAGNQNTGDQNTGDQATGSQDTGNQNADPTQNQDPNQNAGADQGQNQGRGSNRGGRRRHRQRFSDRGFLV